MLQSQKHVFWQALLVTILLFGIGVVVGILIENGRTGTIDKLYQQSELDFMDIKLQSEIYSVGNFNCGSAIDENLNFAEKIYNEAKLLDRYEGASQITDSIISRHKKYDILRANLLINSWMIKQKCNSSYYDVLYLYKYNNKTLEINARQDIFSRLLTQLKEQKGSEILLIPIAGDNDINSINLIKDKYNIKDSELPVIIINGKTKISKLETFDELIKNFQ